MKGNLFGVEDIVRVNSTKSELRSFGCRGGANGKMGTVTRVEYNKTFSSYQYRLSSVDSDTDGFWFLEKMIEHECAFDIGNQNDFIGLF